MLREEWRKHAEELLREQKHMVARVISVDRDSILYLSPTRIARTAWLHDGKVIKTEAGFKADPPPDLHNEAEVPN